MSPSRDFVERIAPLWHLLFFGTLAGSGVIALVVESEQDAQTKLWTALLTFAFALLHYVLNVRMTDPRQELFRVICAAARGETVLSPTVATRLVGRMRAPAQENLSAREIEVLKLVRRGASNKEIAQALAISQATVKTHTLHAFGKLGVDDRTAAVTVALERGILRSDE